MCDVPSIAVFFSESIECFPGTVSKFFLKLLVTIPVAPIITGTIVHFMFHIRCIIIIIIIVIRHYSSLRTRASFMVFYQSALFFFDLSFQFLIFHLSSTSQSFSIV